MGQATPDPTYETNGNKDMADIEKLAEEIVGLTLLEAGQLKDLLKDKYGIEPAAGGAVMMAAAPGEGGGGEAAEEKDEFDVILLEAGDKKINVIKEVRAITSLGLKEAKELVDGAPSPIKEGVSKDEAEEIKGKIDGAGGSVKID